MSPVSAPFWHAAGTSAPCVPNCRWSCPGQATQLDACYAIEIDANVSRCRFCSHTLLAMTDPASVTPQPEAPKPEDRKKPSKANDVILEFFKLIPATSGIMLALIWGLANRSTPPSTTVLWTIRIASLLLAISILACFIGLAGMIDTLHSDEDAYSEKGIRYTVYVAWACFLSGVFTVIFSLFLI